MLVLIINSWIKLFFSQVTKTSLMFHSSPNAPTIRVNPRSYQPAPAPPLSSGRLNPAGSRLNTAGLQHSLTLKHWHWGLTAVLKLPPDTFKQSNHSTALFRFDVRCGFAARSHSSLKVWQPIHVYQGVYYPRLIKNIYPASDPQKRSLQRCIRFLSAPKKTVYAWLSRSYMYTRPASF